MPPKDLWRPPSRPSAGGLPLRVIVPLAVVAVIAVVYAMSRTVTPAEAPRPDQAPMFRVQLYSETADPKADIAAALDRARREHKRVILDFGADWCADCKVLDYYMQTGTNLDLLNGNFVLVHVWIGQMDRNLELAAGYGMDIAKGVPALAVLDASGKTIYAQRSGEFDRMRSMDPATVTAFLTQWKS